VFVKLHDHEDRLAALEKGRREDKKLLARQFWAMNGVLQGRKREGVKEGQREGGVRVPR
jgi:hypothetical protein